MTKRKVIIDCDPGVDDSLMLAYALQSEALDVLAITTVAGNVSVDHTTQNTLNILNLLNKEVPVGKGADRPLVLPPIFADDIHGADGLHGYSFEEVVSIKELPTALEIYKEILEREDKVTIIATGPLTNVAILIKAYPHLLSKIDTISFMGGGIKGGNITVCAEFNIYVDPHAAYVVFNSGIPLIMSGLDVTEKARLTRTDMRLIEKYHPELGKFFLHIFKQGFSIAHKLGHGYTTNLHDVVAVDVLLHPSTYKKEPLKVLVSIEEGPTRGLTYVDNRYTGPNPANMLVVNHIYRKKFKENIFKLIMPSDYR